MSKLPSYKRDATGHVESWRTHGTQNLEPSPFRQNQMMTGDLKKRTPLQYYTTKQRTVLDKHPRACFAVVTASFLGVYTW